MADLADLTTFLSGALIWTWMQRQGRWRLFLESMEGQWTLGSGTTSGSGGSSSSGGSSGSSGSVSNTTPSSQALNPLAPFVGAGTPTNAFGNPTSNPANAGPSPGGFKLSNGKGGYLCFGDVCIL